MAMAVGDIEHHQTVEIQNAVLWSDQINEYLVSTVEVPNGNPVYKTLISAPYGATFDNISWRWSDKQDAADGHKYAIKWLLENIERENNMHQ